MAGPPADIFVMFSFFRDFFLQIWWNDVKRVWQGRGNCWDSRQTKVVKQDSRVKKSISRLMGLVEFRFWWKKLKKFDFPLHFGGFYPIYLELLFIRSIMMHELFQKEVSLFLQSLSKLLGWFSSINRKIFELKGKGHEPSSKFPPDFGPAPTAPPPPPPTVCWIEVKVAVLCAWQYMPWKLLIIKVSNYFWYFNHLTSICSEAY